MTEKWMEDDIKVINFTFSVYVNKLQFYYLFYFVVSARSFLLSSVFKI
jgi:hypothetical protein